MICKGYGWLAALRFATAAQVNERASGVISVVLYQYLNFVDLKSFMPVPVQHCAAKCA